ncbi:hypothetical protein AB9F41_34120, partial [Rhizobium leguminosarum]
MAERSGEIGNQGNDGKALAHQPVDGGAHVTREKVETAIRELGYVRDVAAANIAKGRTYPLVFILPASDNSFMHGLNA